MLPESNVCISDAAEASTPDPTVWFSQQMSLFTELRACVHQSGLPHSEYPSHPFSSTLYTWLAFIL